MTNRDLLELIAGFRQNGRTVPSSGQIAILLDLPPGSQSTVWHALCALQSAGFISGVPSTPRGWNTHVRICRGGYEALGLDVPWSPPRQVKVVPVAWRCEACAAAAVDTSKSCPVCRLSAASVEPVVYEPEEKTA